MAEPHVKVELAAELDRARTRLGLHLAALRQDLDVGTHLKDTYHRNKAAFLGGATLFGLILSKIPPRKKKVYVERKGAVQAAEKAGIWLVLLQLAFNALRPLLTSVVTRQVSEYVRSRVKSAE